MPLFLYLAASEQAVSAVLVVEREKDQIFLYYLSHTLVEAKLKYSLIDKFFLYLSFGKQEAPPIL